MFGSGRKRPVDQFSDRELRSYLAFITVICAVMLVMSCFMRHQAEWIIWIFRGIILFGLVQSWLYILREFRKRRDKR
jgi:hypothetical protein